jgi:hypothetical protein
MGAPPLPQLGYSLTANLIFQSRLRRRVAYDAGLVIQSRWQQKAGSADFM